MKVLVGMSGGVDSSLAAALVKEAGHDVLGVTMQLTRKEQIDAPGFINHGSIQEANDAKKVAKKIGIDFETWDMSELYKEKVVEYFINEYAKGNTPNPCVSCNRNVKFAALVAKALDRGYDKVATGHYARVIDSKLYRGVNAKKDQSYFVASMPPEVVKYCYFPLGEYYDKEDVRQQAKDLGFETYDKKDSSDICFLAKGAKAKFLGSQLKDFYSGNIVDLEGNILKTHTGYWNFTIGQRQGLDIKETAKDGKPRYVVEIRPKTKEVVVGPKEALLKKRIMCNEVKVFDELYITQNSINATLNDEDSDCIIFDGKVQIRAHGKAIDARIKLNHKILKDSNQNEFSLGVEALTDELFDSVAVGQSLVCYDYQTNQQVILKATIC